MSAPAILDEWVDEEPEAFDRITSRPDMLGGKPCIDGTRISVQFALERLAGGDTIGDIVRAYPFLDEEGVKQAILFAASHMTATAYAKARAPE
jgi:uncharacterized protein (DUF433 family)